MDIKAEVKKKRKGKIPLFYLVTILCIILYSTIANAILYFSKNPIFILGLNKLNITITYVWIVYNIGLLIFSLIKRYNWKWNAFCIYYIAINSLNLVNYYSHFYTNYDLLFSLNIFLKIVELVIVVYLITKKEFS